MLGEKAVVDRQQCHMAAKFVVFVDEDQCKLPTLYWISTLHKRSYKPRIIVNSNSCTTTELSIILTSCLTAIKIMLENIVKLFLREMVKLDFGLLKTHVRFLTNEKSKGFLVSSVSTYDFSTL